LNFILRYGILFSNLGDYNDSRPSYVVNSSFHHCYSAAIGVLSSAGIPIENNVVYRTISYGIRVEGNSNIIKGNLVVMNFWSGSFNLAQAHYDRTFLGILFCFNFKIIVSYSRIKIRFEF